MPQQDNAKKKVSLFELVSKLPGALKDLPQIMTALYYNFTVNKETAISIGEIFLKTCKKYPNRKVLYHQDSSWTYREFNEWVNRLSHHFLQSGIRRGDVVAVLLENRPELLAVTMALSKIGGIAALLNTSQKNQTLLHSIKISKAKLLLIGTELQDSFFEIHNDVEINNDAIFMVAHPNYSLNNERLHYSFFDAQASHYESSEPWLPFKIIAADPAMYIFTSGTSGLPKASVISHGRWIKAYSAFGLTSLRLKPEDILYVPLPFYHATAMVVCWSSVVAGGSAVVMKTKFSVSEFWPDIHKYSATGFGYVGELCKYLLTAPVHPLEKNSTLKKMIGNGLRPGIWQQFKERFQIEQVSEFYASSEGNIAFFNVFNIDNTMGFTVTSYAIVEYDKDSGKPVLDKKGHMIKVQPGGVGLLLGEINDRYPFDGYTDPAKTEAVTFRNVFTKGDAWFNTGDLVRDMGFLHTQFVDRLGDTFRWKSENVSTTEVEDIINNFPGINESVVYGVEIPETIGRAGMAQLILEESVNSINLKDFYDFASKELPPYAVPVFLRIADNTEMTSTFKYKKSTLKEQGYNLGLVNDPLYVLLDKQYVRLTPEIEEGIGQGRYRF